MRLRRSPRRNLREGPSGKSGSGAAQRPGLQPGNSLPGQRTRAAAFPVPLAEPQVRKGRRLQNAGAPCRQINCHVLVLINYQKGRSTISLSR